LNALVVEEEQVGEIISFAAWSQTNHAHRVQRPDDPADVAAVAHVPPG
jgi:hypothetical protein